jgi:hypothetical protein
MSSSSRRLTSSTIAAAAVAIFLTALAAPLAVAAPGATKTQRFALSAADTTSRFCATRSVTGAGIDRQRYVVPADGFLTARLSGGSDSSDWDLAVVDAKRRKALNGSAGTSSYEVATTAVQKGQVLWLQACRHAGAARSVALSAAVTKVNWTAMAKQLKGQKVILARVKLDSKADALKLRKLGLDLADHAAGRYWDVQLYSDAEQARLRDAGFRFTVRERDVLGKARRDRVAERRAARGSAARARARASANAPITRTSYRTLPEYQQELRKLAADNPGLVKLVVLPRRSVEGREILGVEIAEGVDRTDDGRPTFVNMGVHHAREWPAAEAPMQFAYDLLANYKAGDARWSAVVRNTRTVVIPIINVDGFDATINSEREDLADPADDQGAGYEQALGIGAYKRKNCSTGDPVTERQPCILRTRPAPVGSPIPPFDGTQLAFRDLGVDLNRNYGEQWGGPGTEHERDGTFPEDPESGSFGITYHGPGAFSEPEVQGFREFTRGRNMSMMIGNHTYTGLILRPPGTSVSGLAEDELRMKELGDAMARETNYISQFGYQLYDTTGTTDDYTYGGLGAFSYTPEIGKENFHPNYVNGFIPEYDGQFVEDPDTGAPTTRKRGGLRMAYLEAAEVAADLSSHSVLRGTAPAGRTLKLSRVVVTNPSTSPDDNGINDGPDTPNLETRTLTLTVPASGQFEWHIPPSRQPGKATLGSAAPWRLTCEDGTGVREARNVAIERGQALSITLACGATSTPAPGGATCTDPDGFRSVRVRRTGKSLRISFSKKTRNAVTVEVFQTSKGRKIVKTKRVARFRNRQRSFTWNGRKTSGKKARVARGVYFVRFRVTDDAGKVETRRVVVAKRSNGRFYKRGRYVLETHCP